MTNPIISLKNINHSFEDIAVLNDITFDVAKHEFVSVIGPSGCGKSTLFKILTKIITDYEGDIKIHNKNLAEYKEGIGYMPQKDLLLPWRTLTSNITLPLEIAKKDVNNDQINSLIKTFGLSGFESHYPHQLSGGMKQRAALLRTFLMGNDIMLLDEPFAALDYLTKRKLQAWFKDLFATLETTALFITHDIEEAINLSDKVIVLSALPASILKIIPTKGIDSNLNSAPDQNAFAVTKKQIIELIG